MMATEMGNPSEINGTSQNSSGFLCDTFFDPDVTLYITGQGCSLVASFILLIMMIIRKKIRHGRCCCKCCCGIVVPVKFLEDKRNRASIIAVFMLVSRDVYQMLFIVNIDKIFKALQLDAWLKFCGKLFFVQVLSAAYLPILVACSNNSSIFVQFLGIIYMCVELFNTVLTTFPWCEERLDFYNSNVDNEMTIMFFAISVTAFVIVCFGFIKKIIQISHQRVYQINPELNQEDFHLVYVKNILNSSKRVRFDEDYSEKEKSGCSKYVYSNTKGFRYSLTILIGIYVGFTAVLMIAVNYYKLVVKYYPIALEKIEFLRNLTEEKKAYYELLVVLVKAVFTLIPWLLFNGEDSRLEKIMEANITVYEIVIQQVKVGFSSLFVAITLSLIILFISFLNMLTHYKNNVLQLSKQINLGHLIDVKSISNTNIIVNATQFAGYQAAHFIWGFHIQTIVLLLVLIAFCEVIIVPLNIDFEDYFYILVQFIAPILVVFIVTMVVQYLLVRFLFIQDAGKVLALDNRRCFYQMMYLMFFFNLLCGIITCLLRILKSLIFSILILPRIDRCAFPHAFSKFDSGFKAYACLLRLEAIQSNSILIVFSRICKCSKQRRLDYSALAKNIIRPRKIWCKRQCRARNRWFLAWTLIYNGHLLQGERKTKTQLGPLGSHILRY